MYRTGFVRRSTVARGTSRRMRILRQRTTPTSRISFRATHHAPRSAAQSRQPHAIPRAHARRRTSRKRAREKIRLGHCSHFLGAWRSHCAIRMARHRMARPHDRCTNNYFASGICTLVERPSSDRSMGRTFRQATLAAATTRMIFSMRAGQQEMSARGS